MDTSKEEVSTIKKIQFGLLSAEKVLEMSVCEIYKPLLNTPSV